MKEIIVKPNNQGDLIPVDQYDRTLVIEALKPTKEYTCKIIQTRNLKHLSKYWVLMKALEFHFDQPDVAYHMYFKELFLEPIILTLKDGTVKKYPNSIAFDKMNQLEFDAYYKKIEQWLNAKGLDIDELINTMEI